MVHANTTTQRGPTGRQIGIARTGIIIPPTERAKPKALSAIGTMNSRIGTIDNVEIGNIEFLSSRRRLRIRDHPKSIAVNGIIGIGIAIRPKQIPIKMNPSQTGIVTPEPAIGRNRSEDGGSPHLHLVSRTRKFDPGDRNARVTRVANSPWREIGKRRPGLRIT